MQSEPSLDYYWRKNIYIYFENRASMTLESWDFLKANITPDVS